MTEAQGWWLWQISIGRERGKQRGLIQTIAESCEQRGWAVFDRDRGWHITPQGQAALTESFIMDSDDPQEHARILTRGPLTKDTRQHLQAPK